MTPIVANFRGKYRLVQVYHVCGPADHVRAKVPNVDHDVRSASGYNVLQSIGTEFGAGFGHEEFTQEKIR